MERGRVTVRTVEAKGLPTAKVVRRLPKGESTRKLIALKISQGISINRDVSIVRVDNASNGDPQFIVQAPLSVILSRVESVILET